MGLVAPSHVASSQTWDGTRVLCIARQILNHWTIRVVLSSCLSESTWYIYNVWCRYCCCSVAKSCPTFRKPIGSSMPGFPVVHHLSEFAQTHVYLSQWHHPTISSSVAPFCFCPVLPSISILIASWLSLCSGCCIFLYWDSFLLSEMRHWSSPSSSLSCLIFSVVTRSQELRTQITVAGENRGCDES